MTYIILKKFFIKILYFKILTINAIQIERILYCTKKKKIVVKFKNVAYLCGVKK